MIIDIYLAVLLSACVVLLRTAHILCVSVLYVHVFNDKHVIMWAHVCVFSPDLADFYILFFILIIKKKNSLGFPWCPF